MATSVAHHTSPAQHYIRANFMPTTPGLRNPRVMQFSGPASVSLFPPYFSPIPTFPAREKGAEAPGRRGENREQYDLGNRGRSSAAERYGKALVMREASLIMNSRPLHAGAALCLSGTTLYITAGWSQSHQRSPPGCSPIPVMSYSKICQIVSPRNGPYTGRWWSSMWPPVVGKAK